MTRILILGGGFGGIYAARELERQLGRDNSVEVTLVARDNYFLFTPMLHEVAASDLDLTHIVSPIRKLLRRTQFFQGEVLGIDFHQQRVQVVHGAEDAHPHDLEYDYLVLALGAETNFFGIPGLENHAFTMRTLGDAIALRNRLIESLEEADSECCGDRSPLTTFVVAGGGFAGVETVGAIHDFARQALRFYPNVQRQDLRFVLVHPGEVVLPELGTKLGAYAQTKLAQRGVEIVANTKVAGLSRDGVRLTNGTCVKSRTLVWTAGTSPHPLLADLPCAKDRGRLRVDATLQVPEWPQVYALGDCAVVPDPLTGGSHPPTAQHACRMGVLAARNVVAAMRGRPGQEFRFQMLGQLASIGRRAGVASMFGLKFSGFIAWWLWRTVYLAKLPRFDRKVRVALDWTLDLVFSKDLVECPQGRVRALRDLALAPTPVVTART